MRYYSCLLGAKKLAQIRSFDFSPALRITLAAIILTLNACGGGSSATSSGGNNPAPAPNTLGEGLQLDYIGTIPVLNGAPTSSYFYIHNDSDSEISGINYTLADLSGNQTEVRSRSVKLATNDVMDKNGFVLKGDSLAKCATIAANSYCKVEFVTPELPLGHQNNSLLKVSATDTNGVVQTFDQVIDYSYYNVALNDGVNFATSADVVANISNRRYVLGYLVGGGSGKSYSNVELKTVSSGAIEVNQGFLDGQSMSSAELIPVEFKVNVLAELPIPANVTPQYSLGAAANSQSSKQTTNSLKANTVAAGQSLYINTSNLATSALALKVGAIPILPAPTTESSEPTIYVSNFGGSISGLSIEPLDSAIAISANSCQDIKSRSSCSFKLAISSHTSGSGTLMFKLNGQTFYREIYYLPSDGKEAYIISTVPVTQIGLLPNQTTSVINILYTNLGLIPLSGSSIAAKNSGGNTHLKVINNSCTPTVAARSQCLVQVQAISGSNSEIGHLYLDLTGTSGAKALTRKSGIINYTVNDLTNLTFTSPTGAEATLSILGDNQDSASSVFTVKNVGNSSSAIKSISLNGVNLPAALTISSNTCGNSLAAGASCQITVNYGPQLAESNNSGIANLQVNYGENNKIILTGNINYSVAALNSYLAITNVAVSGYSGNGTQSNPYLGSGCNNNPLTMTITYKNMSTEYIAQNMALNVIDGHISPYMSVDGNASSCGYGANPKNLGIGQSCNLVLTASRSNMNDNSSYNLNVIYPSASWSTAEGVIRQNNFIYNGSSTAYVSYTQPAMVSSINPLSGFSYTRTLTQSLVNAEGCGNIETLISAIPNVTAVTVASGNCTVNGDLSVSCTNSSVQNSNTITYTVSSSIPTPADLFMTFTLQTTAKQVWYNPNILLFRIGN